MTVYELAKYRIKKDNFNRVCNIWGTPDVYCNIYKRTYQLDATFHRGKANIWLTDRESGKGQEITLENLTNIEISENDVLIEWKPTGSGEQFSPFGNQLLIHKADNADNLQFFEWLSKSTVND